MRIFLYLVKNVKNLLLKIKHVETGCLTATKEFKMTDKQASKQNDGDIEAPPAKKLCIKETQEILNKEEKIRNKKVALLLSYIGDNYCGMQRNAPFKTIEGELLLALHKANYIPEIAVDDPYKINFQRTARTDKGVSAVKQLVSLKMAANSTAETVNKYLPEDIRVLSIKRVTRGFHCQNDCSARIYSYTLPTFALAPELHDEYPQNYRINQETIDKVNDILHSYVGTHNFHNFTSKKNFEDPSANRYMLSFKAGEPFIGEGEEFITLTVNGQSFMLHQIRKMVGHMIAIMKGVAPPNISTEVWSGKKFSVPMVRGLGLVLEDVLFHRYNRKYENDGIHESLVFEEVADEVSNFRKKIVAKIVKKEVEEKVMFNWLELLKFHTYVKEESTPAAEEEKSEIANG